MFVQMKIQWLILSRSLYTQSKPKEQLRKNGSLYDLDVVSVSILENQFELTDKLADCKLETNKIQNLQTTELSQN